MRGTIPKISPIVKVKLKNAIGIENLKSAHEISKSTGFSESQIRGAMFTVKKYFRQDKLLLRNSHIGNKKDGTYKSGYYIVRLFNGKDILPPENRDFRAICNTFKNFIEIWQSIKWKELNPEQRKELHAMRYRMIDIISGWGEKHV